MEKFKENSKEDTLRLPQFDKIYKETKKTLQETWKCEASMIFTANISMQHISLCKLCKHIYSWMSKFESMNNILVKIKNN